MINSSKVYAIIQKFRNDAVEHCTKFNLYAPCIICWTDCINLYGCARRLINSEENRSSWVRLYSHNITRTRKLHAPTTGGDPSTYAVLSTIQILQTSQNCVQNLFLWKWGSKSRYTQSYCETKVSFTEAKSKQILEKFVSKRLIRKWPHNWAIPENNFCFAQGILGWCIHVNWQWYGTHR